MACHTRSKAEEGLNKLKASVASPSFSFEIMLDAVKAVGQVYECINNLLCISSIRNGLSQSKQRSIINQELEACIKLIDICSISRDNLDLIKGQLQDLESALRRKDESQVIMESKVRECNLSVKKAKKDVKKLLAVNRSEYTVSSDVASLLLETREFTVSMLQSLFSFLPKQLLGQKTSKWPAVRRFLQESKVENELEILFHVFDISSLKIYIIEGLEN